MSRLELVDVSKRYPGGVTANDRVSLAVSAGEIHAVLGENGAGKSTLMKLIYGMLQPDSGELRWNGEPLVVPGPHAARQRGISMVFQHFSLFESLTVAQNVWLGLERRCSLSEVESEVRRVGDQYGIPLDPDRPVHALSVGERQRVEILRALSSRPELLILDEPTSVLTPQAAQALFVTLRKLAAEGCAILYISHKLGEIRELCQTATVLRAGRVVGTCEPARESTASLARLMLGETPPQLQRRPGTAEERPAPREATLQVEALSVDDDPGYGVPLRGIDLELRGGEILGVAGVSGNGQRELLCALAGESSSRLRGSIRWRGTDITDTGPKERRRLGLRFVPEERLGRAVVPSLSLAQNTLLTRPEAVTRAGFWRRGALRALASRLLAAHDVKAQGPDAPASSLSGGNLQKFILARELDAAPQVFLVAQPTWGVDVGAAAQIKSRLLALRDAGHAVLVVSEDLDELFEICDALVVMAGGEVSPRLRADELRADQIGEWMSGLWPRARDATRREERHVARA